ncbi:MAG TPA: hypothetical protein VFR02_08930, partial [bacterium]|nr:hypothetical protein [bacterium]
MRRAWSLAALLGAPLLLAAPPLSAQTTGPNGLRLDFQTGIQVEGAPVDYFQAARVLLDRDESLVDGLDLRWGGEALWMAARGNPLP